MTPEGILRTVEAGFRMVNSIYELVRKATQGDDEAAETLRRFDNILSETSPTGSVFERADEIADSKP